MFFYDNVFLVDGNGNHIKHIDMVAALSESSARQQVYNKFGSASKYSGWGYDNFKAVKC